MKTLVGLFMVVIIIMGLVWFSRKEGSFLYNLLRKDKETGQQQAELIDQNDEMQENGMSQNGSPAPDSLLTCTAELLAQDCSSVDKKPVCSVDVLQSGKGIEQTSNTEYISACHYCKFFGADGAAEFGDERIVTRGYTEGACQQ